MKKKKKAYRGVRLLNYSFGDSDKKRYEAEIVWSQTSSARCHAEQELLILVDSILPLVEKQDTCIYGWEVNHKFKCKVAEAYPKYYDYTYYLDKDCNQILFKANDELSWSNDDVEFANRIYKHAIERRKEKTK